MPITYLNSAATGNDANESVKTITVPGGTQQNDVATAILSRWGGNPTITLPPGFVHAGTQVLSGDGAARLDLYYKRLTGTDSGTYQWSWTGELWSHVHCLWFRGVKQIGDPVGPYFTSWSGTAGIYGTTSLSPTFAPALVWSTYNDSGGTHTPPTSFAEVIDFDCGAAAYSIPGSSGSYSAANGSVTSSSPAAAMLFALEPEPAGGGGIAKGAQFLPFLG